MTIVIYFFLYIHFGSFETSLSLALTIINVIIGFIAIKLYIFNVFVGMSYSLHATIITTQYNSYKTLKIFLCRMFLKWFPYSIAIFYMLFSIMVLLPLN